MVERPDRPLRPRDGTLPSRGCSKHHHHETAPRDFLRFEQLRRPRGPGQRRKLDLPPRVLHAFAGYRRSAWPNMSRSGRRSCPPIRPTRRAATGTSCPGWQRSVEHRADLGCGHGDPALWRVGVSLSGRGDAVRPLGQSARPLDVAVRLLAESLRPEPPAVWLRPSKFRFCAPGGPGAWRAGPQAQPVPMPMPPAPPLQPIPSTPPAPPAPLPPPGRV